MNAYEYYNANIDRFMSSPENGGRIAQLLDSREHYNQGARDDADMIRGETLLYAFEAVQVLRGINNSIDVIFDTLNQLQGSIYSRLGTVATNGSEALKTLKSIDSKLDRMAVKTSSACPSLPCRADQEADSLQELRELVEKALNNDIDLAAVEALQSMARALGTIAGGSLPNEACKECEVYRGSSSADLPF